MTELPMRLLGRDYPDPWPSGDFDHDPDWEWHSAAVASVLATGDGLDQLVAKSPWPETRSLRRGLVDLIEEYARHPGHTDLIRESVDGLVGEDPEG